LGHFLLQSVPDCIGVRAAMSFGEIACPESRSGHPWPHFSTKAPFVALSVWTFAFRARLVDGFTWPFLDCPHLSRNFFFRPVIRISRINALK
jgi:hypothetical protein